MPATLAARVRVLGTGRSNKNDPNDALSVAIAALRTTGLRRVAAVGHAEVLRLLAKRNIDIGRHRTRVVSRLHALLVELAPGGIAKEINASDVDRFLAEVTPATPVEQIRYDLAVELLDDIRRLDAQLKASHKRIRTAVAASDTTVTDLFGVGPIIAAMLIGYTGDIDRFANRDHYAAYNGTAPVEFSSGGRVVHRALAARQPPTQPRAPHGRDLPAPPTPLRRPRLLRPQESPKARPRRKRSARSSVTSATPSTANSSPTPAAPEAERAREDKRERLDSQRDRLYIPDDRLFGEVTPGPNTNATTTAPRRRPDNAPRPAPEPAP